MNKVNKQVNTYADLEVYWEITLDVSVWIDQDNARFELYDVESGGEEFYSAGMLGIDDGVLYDYDGVFELPIEVLDILKEMGIDTTQI